MAGLHCVAALRVDGGLEPVPVGGQVQDGGLGACTTRCDGGAPGDGGDPCQPAVGLQSTGQCEPEVIHGFSAIVVGKAECQGGSCVLNPDPNSP